MPNYPEASKEIYEIIRELYGKLGKDPAELRRISKDDVDKRAYRVLKRDSTLAIIPQRLIEDYLGSKSDQVKVELFKILYRGFEYIGWEEP